MVSLPGLFVLISRKIRLSALLLAEPLPELLSCGGVSALAVEEIDPAPVALMAVNGADAVAVEHIHGLLRSLFPCAQVDRCPGQCGDLFGQQRDADPDAAFLSELETKLEAVADDVNGDGKVKVNVKSIWLSLNFEVQDASVRQLMQSSEDKLNSDFYLCESTLFIVDDPAAMEQRYGCFRLLDGTDPQEGDRVSTADFAGPKKCRTRSGASAVNVKSPVPAGTKIWSVFVMFRERPCADRTPLPSSTYRPLNESP